MARKLYIHVGPSKTGTSAVQHFFRSHEHLPVIYPRVGLWSDGAHHNLVFNLYQNFSRPEVARSDPAEMLEAISREASRRSGALLISSECLAGRDVGVIIRALLATLGDGWQPEIIVVCREHLERASSMYNQIVKDVALFERRPPDAYLKSADDFCYFTLVQELSSSGFPVTVLNYHPAADFVPRFLRHLDIAAPESAQEKRNISLSRQALIATLAANNVAQDATERQHYFTVLRSKLRPFFAPSAFIFGKEAAAAATLRFGEDRRFLLREFGLLLPEINPTSQENMFWITPAELNGVAVSISELGAAGEAIIDYAHRFLREDPVLSFSNPYHASSPRQ